MPEDKWRPVHEIVAQLIQADPSANLGPLAILYAKGAKVPGNAIGGLIEAFEKAQRYASPLNHFKLGGLVKKAISMLEEQLVEHQAQEERGREQKKEVAAAFEK